MCETEINTYIAQGGGGVSCCGKLFIGNQYKTWQEQHKQNVDPRTPPLRYTYRLQLRAHDHSH